MSEFDRMQTPIFKLALGYLAVAAGELAVHAYISYGTSRFASVLLAIYLHKDPLNGRTDTAGMVDLVVPAVVLGMLSGKFEAQLPREKMWRHVTILAAGVLLLIPLYITMAQAYSYPLSHLTNVSIEIRIRGFLYSYLVVLLMTGTGAYFGRRHAKWVEWRRKLAK